MIMYQIKPVTDNQIIINSSPEKIFDFVTVPDNWVGTHPVTKAVKGETGISAGLGKRWIEVIEGGGITFDAEWEVIACERPSLWRISASNFNNTSFRVIITYTFNKVDGGTLFRREMAVEFEDNPELYPMAESLKKSSEAHDQYLLKVKQCLESK